jgi:quercetin dioxygenase-like cupin family protein
MRKASLARLSVGRAAADANAPKKPAKKARRATGQKEMLMPIESKKPARRWRRRKRRPGSSGNRPELARAKELCMEIDIKRNGSRPSQKGLEDWFTGAVRIDPLFQAPEPARASGARVTFEPGAHTAWHTHPLGQTLIVTAGLGWAQCEGGVVEEIRPGDVVWFPPGVKHWHGASPKTAMTHIAIQEALYGSPVTWMEKVSDD